MYQLPFDLRTDLQPLSLLSVGTMWIIGRKDLPAQNLQELIAWLKSDFDLGLGHARAIVHVILHGAPTDDKA